MKAHVDQSGCISCALCVDTCPEIFHFNKEAKAEAVGQKNPKRCHGLSRESERWMSSKCYLDSMSRV